MFVKNTWLILASTYQKYQKSIDKLTIFLIFLLGFYIRIHLYPSNSVWTGDTGRDMLAGYLIAFKNMNSKFGPYNTGIDFFYPPAYYYFIAILTMIARGNHDIIVGLIILYQSVGIILTFSILKKEFSKLPAFLISVLYALSPAFIYYSMLQISVSNSVILVLLSLTFFQSALRNKKKVSLIISGILLSLAISFWYGSIFILPVPLLVLLLNSDKNEAKKSRFLAILIFSLSVVISFLIIFTPIINYSNLRSTYQSLFGSSLNQLSLKYFNFNNFLESFDARMQILHPECTFIMYLIYGLIVIVAFLLGKNKYTKKFVLISILTLLLHFVFYNTHKAPLGHYLNNVFFIFAGLLACGLQIALEKNKIFFLALSLIILISSNSFRHEILVSELSYQHLQLVNNQVSQHFPKASILDGGELCTNTVEPFYWDSRIYWYFQREKPYFSFDDINNQVGLINPNTVLLCWQDLNLDEIDNTYQLKKEEAALKFKLFNFEYAIFEVFENEKQYF